jgi:hypothetical protein
MLNWLFGTSLVSLVLALISDQILKALSNEATVITHNVRGGIFGAVWGITTGTLGMPGARKSVRGWRERIFLADKDK